MATMMTGKRGMKQGHFFTPAILAYTRSLSESMYEPMTIQQEIELSSRLSEESVRHEFYIRNLRFAFAIATEMRGKLEDMISASNDGLRIAVDKYDPQRGAKFSTFAVFWIKQSIMKNQVEDRIVRIPATSMRRQRMVKAMSEQGHSDDAIARELSLSKKMVRNHRLVDANCVALDVPLNDDSHETAKDRLASTADNSSENSEFISHVLNQLTDREKYIITNRFGLGGDEKESLDSLAGKLGVSKECVRLWEEKALMRMRKCTA